MLRLTYGMLEVSQAETFEEIFIDLYDRIVEDMKISGMSFQFLETTIWIESDTLNYPIYFYEARDMACEVGLLKDGEIVESFREKFSTKDKPEQELSTTIECKKCSSVNVDEINFLNNAYTCNNCGEQFLAGKE